MSIKINQLVANTKGLSLKNSGNYLFRMRINRGLKRYFNRIEIKKTYKSEVNIFDVIKDIDIIQKQYEYIKRVVMSNIIDEKQIMALVEKYLIDNLNEDYEIRLSGGSGLVETSQDDYFDKQTSIINATAYLLSEAKENLVNANDKSMEENAKELLNTIDVNYDTLEDTCKGNLLYLLKQHQVKLLEELLNRNKNPHVVKRIDKIETQKEKQKDKALIVEVAIKEYLDFYETSNTTTEKNLKEKINALNYFKDVVGAYRDVKELKSSDINTYVNKYLKNKPKRFRNLTNQQIINLINEDKITEDKYSANTVNKHYQHICGFLNYLVNDDLIEKNIANVKVEQELENRDSFTEKDVVTLNKALMYNDTLFKLFNVYIYTGMRNSELWQSSIILLEDEDNNSILTFKVEGTKTSSSNRIIPLHKELIKIGINNEWLKDLKHNYKNYKYLSRQINTEIKKSIDDSDKKTLYSARHYFITKLMRASVNSDIINKLVGHNDKKNLNSSVYGRNAYDINILNSVINKIQF
ncbi:tyrosine-type recombinase/integrase [Aliarcobacter cryaerophilus]|uniref:tyrosine-type recombinase/integrase n=1 Tax=Aliarcobacter cryaerophilus TaxID=28198 RepID=UPI003DA60481